MDNRIRKVIEQKYDVKIKSIVPGPRQFVAETFVLQVENNSSYFLKIIPRSEHTSKIIKSLPIQEELYKSGISNINYPIPTASGELYVISGDLFFVLFNYIDAVQTFEFDKAELGRLIAQIHSKTDKIAVSAPKENFSLLYKEEFERYFKQSLTPTVKDHYISEMQKLLLRYEKEIRQDWENFFEIIDKCKNTKFDFVLTHGDPTGNILNDTNKNMYLVDWDTILLAPQERDLWFLKDNKGFMQSYTSVYPDYKVNNSAYKFYLYNRYFEDMVGYMDNILNSESSEHKKKINFEDLKRSCFDEWLLPLIRNIVF